MLMAWSGFSFVERDAKRIRQDRLFEGIDERRKWVGYDPLSDRLVDLLDQLPDGDEAESCAQQFESNPNGGPASASAEYYRGIARECRKVAAKTANLDARQHWLAAADRWLEFARLVEASAGE